MHVRMKIDVSGSRDGEPWPKRGEAFEVADAEGADLCASGLATPVVESDVEKAVEADDSEQRTLTKEKSSAVTAGAVESNQPGPVKKAPAKRAPAKPTQSDGE